MKIEICEYGVIRHISDEVVEIFLPNTDIMRIEKNKIVDRYNTDLENKIKKVVWGDE